MAVAIDCEGSLSCSPGHGHVARSKATQPVAVTLKDERRLGLARGWRPAGVLWASWRAACSVEAGWRR